MSRREVLVAILPVVGLVWLGQALRVATTLLPLAGSLWSRDDPAHGALTIAVAVVGCCVVLAGAGVLAWHRPARLATLLGESDTTPLGGAAPRVLLRLAVPCVGLVFAALGLADLAAVAVPIATRAWVGVGHGVHTIPALASRLGLSDWVALAGYALPPLYGVLLVARHRALTERAERRMGLGTASDGGDVG